jgi:hypothetical protein
MRTSIMGKVLSSLLFLLLVTTANAETTPTASPSPSGSASLTLPSVGASATGSKLDEGSIVDRFPELGSFIREEQASGLYFGFGVSPVTLVNGKFGFAASIFQLHYMKKSWDIELVNLSFGTAFGDTLGKEQFFLLRAAPKFKIYRNISIGPLLGIEFVQFPNVTAAVTKNVDITGDGVPENAFTEQFDFSTFGYFYGGAISQLFEMGPRHDKAIRVSALYFQERYSVTETRNGWTYYLQPNELNFDKTPIAPASMFMLEISYLY